jgi:hypothetical protein
VGVPLDHRGIGPAHHVHHGSFQDAEEQQDRGCCVTGVVQARLADSCFLEQLFPFVLVTARVDRIACWLGEHPVARMPLDASIQPLCILPSAMLCDQREQLVRQGDAATANGGLHLDFDQATTAPVWAPAGMTGAVGWAGRWAFPLVPPAVLRTRLDLVVTDAASVRVSAAVTI